MIKENWGMRSSPQAQQYIFKTLFSYFFYPDFLSLILFSYIFTISIVVSLPYVHYHRKKTWSQNYWKILENKRVRDRRSCKCRVGRQWLLFYNDDFTAFGGIRWRNIAPQRPRPIYSLYYIHCFPLRGSMYKFSSFE